MDEYGPGDNPNGGWSFWSGGEEVAPTDAQIAAIRDGGLTADTSGYDPLDYGRSSDPFDWGNMFKAVGGIATGVVSIFATRSGSPAFATRSNGPSGPGMRLPGIRPAIAGGGPGGGGFFGGGGGFSLSPTMIAVGIGILVLLFVVKR